MKLNIVPARQGTQWVKLGIQTFFRQPLALVGLFFLFLALISVLSIVPVLGNALALALVPGATLGLMTASQEAANGKFPMPTVLLTAFRSGRERMQAMLTLGAMYSGGFLLMLAVSALADGGAFAKLYLVGGSITLEMAQSAEFQLAALIVLALYLPLSLMFWHAPALVHWHGVSPAKSLFFSIVACWRNLGAYTLYGLVWFGTFMLIGTVVTSVVALFGDAELVAATLLPMALLLATMFFTSIYFTFRDSFDTTSGDSE